MSALFSAFAVAIFTAADPALGGPGIIACLIAVAWLTVLSYGDGYPLTLELVYFHFDNAHILSTQQNPKRPAITHQIQSPHS
ncbi:hypothetical protein E6O75_ATG10306 [Venturia nashicola]|uniref:Uncharacterized protein n=1 Tax=Venturia nashicola TaxID=86259 RepID=A0A4Z1NCX6_9PEZI|nr:hypothetical protein E6O75_ATG10306 [Venturia nashicola]